jgi:hypothetical protein
MRYGLSRHLLAAATLVALGSCGGDPQLVVHYNPYADVDFQSSPRLLAQHHDHAGVSQSSLRAYDNAGYNVLSLQDYSGNRRATYAWTERRWPPEQWLPAAFLSTLRNLEMFLPNAEEVGIPELHVTSAFMRKYIEVNADPQATPQAWQYRTGTQLIDLVRDSGGVPCVAHPFEILADTDYWAKVPCIEIYTAFAAAQREQGNAYFSSPNRNQIMRSNWDRLLSVNPRVLGIAVNDHFGPDTPPWFKVSPQVRDSGKVLVFAPRVTMEAYEQAFRRGAFFAVVDRGAVKGNFPHVKAVLAYDHSLYVETDDTVKWITNFGVVGNDKALLLGELHKGTTYARAEISNAEGSVVYTQAFTIRRRDIRVRRDAAPGA